MALAVNSLSNSGDLTSVSSATWAHTCAGSGLILVVGVNARGVNSDTNTTVTGVTYNGVALTKIRGDTSDAGDTFRGRSELWYLIAPTTGAHNVVVTFTGTVVATGCGAISLTGAIQGTGAIDAHNGAVAQTDTTPSVDVTVVAANCYLIDTIYSRSDTLAKDASQTTIMAIASSGGGDDSAMTYKVSPGTGAQTMAYTSGAEESALSAVSISPALATSYFLPTTTDISSGVTTPDNAWAEDDVYAVFTATNQFARYSTWGDFAIPSGNSIVGIEVRARGKNTGAGVNHALGAKLSINSGSSFSSSKTIDFNSTSEVEITVGGSADLWGRSPTLTDFDGTLID